MKTNYPEEYTRWWVEFYYQKFRVNESVLIPRFETECLVREVVKEAKATSYDILMDIGTGSGIIPVSILWEVSIFEAYAVDVSSEALNVARENAKYHDVKDIRFLISDLLSIFLESENIPVNKNILITANLPYIKQDDYENMSADTAYEPKLALFGGKETGFELYEKLFVQLELFIQRYHPQKFIFLAEMGDDQKVLATEVLAKHGWKFSFFSDLRGIQRFMRIDF